MKSLKYIFSLSFFSTIIETVFADRLKDMVSFAGIRSNQLMGYGIVVGLDGTWFIARSYTSKYAINNITVWNECRCEWSEWKNSAAVMITADLDPFYKSRSKNWCYGILNGKAKSLRGGTLLMTPLKGADGKIYAIAQGNLAVGGFGVEGADGSSMSVNIPTVGTISNGATVENGRDTFY